MNKAMNFNKEKAPCVRCNPREYYKALHEYELNEMTERHRVELDGLRASHVADMAKTKAAGTADNESAIHRPIVSNDPYEFANKWPIVSNEPVIVGNGYINQGNVCMSSNESLQ